ncbi:MAG: oligoribonuclease [Microbacteriaceae bacterium]|nr:oligoribonuclease [Cryobacterium sp.]MBX3104872.1 oligoribonuclease [Cryobacterium sp.]MCC6375494.1 oligoribonuclease [Microbacteriaceae bacterium]
MAASNDRLVWIDCEMTGLDVETDQLLEVAVVITDFELKILDPGLNVVIKADAAKLEAMSDFVKQMHSSSGLIDEIASGLELADAQSQILKYIQRFVPGAQQAPLAGNTIGTDRAFLARYMPLVDGYLHYRNVDVSSIKELIRRWIPRIYFNAPEKDGGHRALADIRESIRELEYYRRAAFVAEPGPTTEQTQIIAAAVVEQFANQL